MDKIYRMFEPSDRLQINFVSMIPTKTTVYCVSIPSEWGLKVFVLLWEMWPRICRITNDSLCCLTCTFLKLWWQLFKQIFYTKVWTLLFWSAHFKAHFWRRDVKWIIENSLFLWTMYQSHENKCDNCLWVAFYLKSQ